MAKSFTPIERFIAGIPGDRRRAYDARQLDRGFRRVTITVPSQHVDALKAFGRLLRNSEPADLEELRRDLNDYLRDMWADYDQAVASGEVVEEWPEHLASAASRHRD